MTYDEVMRELESYGTEQNRKIYSRHGADIPMFGVSVANIKKLAKKIKGEHEIGFKLFNSNNVDAIYLSQFVLDSSRLTVSDIEKIIESTEYYMILDGVIGSITAKNKDIAFEVLERWLTHDNHRFRQAGYGLYSLMLMSYDNELLDNEDVMKKVKHIEENIHGEANRVRYNMNNFLITAGTTFPENVEVCKDVALNVGKVEVSMGETSCKVPNAFTYIEKIEKMGKVGKKRKI